MKFKQTKIFIAILFTIIASFSSSLIVFGQTSYGNDGKTYKLLAPLPCIESKVETKDANGNVISTRTLPCPSAPAGQVSTLSTVPLSDYFQYMFNLLIAISAAAAVFMITYGGFLYVTTESWTGKGDAKKKIWDAVEGLLMVLCAYLVLKTVNPKLVAIPASIPALDKTLLSQGAQDQLTALDQINQLNGDASAFQQQGQQAVDAAKQAQAQLAQYQQQKTDLQNKIDTLTAMGQEASADDTEALTDAKTQLTQLDDLIKNTQANKIVNSAKSSMSNGVITTTLLNLSNQKSNDAVTLDSINHEYTTSMAALTQIKSNSNTQLDQMNAPTQKNQINDQAAYSANVIEIVKDQAILNNISGSDALYSQIKANLDLVEKNLPSITDPALKADLQSRLQTTKDSYNTAKNKYDINSTYEL